MKSWLIDNLISNIAVTVCFKSHLLSKLYFIIPSKNHKKQLSILLLKMDAYFFYRVVYILAFA